ncbi:MAG: dihydrofolate reductase family protein [Myxococcaceae bacterium]
MGLLRGYIASSVDGFIATPDGGVGWLDPYNEEDFGYADFDLAVGTVVMGRITYEQVLTFGKWPYRGKRAIVLSSRGIAKLPPGAEARKGRLPELVAELRKAEKDSWIVGGAKALRGFLELEALDQLDLFVIPVLLGNGVPLFERRAANNEKLSILEARAFDNGVVKLSYHLPVAARRRPVPTPRTRRAPSRKPAASKGD